MAGNEARGEFGEADLRAIEAAVASIRTLPALEKERTAALLALLNQCGGAVRKLTGSRPGKLAILAQEQFGALLRVPRASFQDGASAPEKPTEILGIWIINRPCTLDGGQPITAGSRATVFSHWPAGDVCAARLASGGLIQFVASELASNGSRISPLY